MGQQPAGQNLGRPPVLDETKRRTIIALLANGSSRRMAAGYVGCAPSTITRTAARDPEFAAQLARAEGNAETEALSLIRKAAHKECYWRAAAWLLERKNPADFAARKPDVMTPEQLRRVLASLATLILQDLSEEKLEQVLLALDQVRLDEEPGGTGETPVALGAGKMPMPPYAEPAIPSPDRTFATAPAVELQGLRE